MSSINYEDERFAKVEEERQEALTENEQLYGGMIDKSDEFYQGLVDESKAWAEQQSQIQQEQTDFAIEQIEQQKEKAEKDYLKEQKGAYKDYQKQTNAYGAEAEQMADNGLSHTGFSESSKVSMYNTYQNRVTTAKASFDNAVLTYNNAIKEAKLQNSSAQAEIAHNALVQQLQYLLQGFNYKNELLLDEANKKLTINSMYDSKYQAIVDQINTENALAEQKRQFDESLKATRSSSGGGYVGGYYVTGGGTVADNCGNSQEIMNKTDYYFSNGYQPQYINNTKLAKSGMTTDILAPSLGVPKGQNIWVANGQYYVWIGSAQTYANVTEKVTFSNGYQPMYIGNTKLNAVGTIKNTIGSYGKLPTSQNVWQSGSKYYVWDGSSRKYIDVTSQYKSYSSKKQQNTATSWTGTRGLW